MKKILLVLLLFAAVSFEVKAQSDTVVQQSDSLYFREQDLKRISTNYFNLSKPNKFNFEVIVIGGVKNPGVYLIPEGTSLVEVVALTGGAPDESIFDDFKLIRSKKKNPELKSDTVFVLNYNDFFDKDNTGKILNANPLLKSGDIIAFPIKPERDFWQIAQGIASVVIVPLITLASLIINILTYNNSK